MNNKRYLTKSRFKEGLECPTKLYYSKNLEYKNNQLEDPFLESLAEGGYQVGELSKFLISDNPYQQNITIETLDYDLSLKETSEKLKNEKVSIAESVKYMFRRAYAFNQDVSDWNTSSVTAMNDMFRNTTAFNQNLTAWCVCDITSEPSTFANSSALTDANKPVWGTCP